MAASMDQGSALLCKLAKAAVARLAALPPHEIAAARSLFSPEELKQLAAELHAVRASGDLLGRSLLQDHAQRAKKKGQRLGESLRESLAVPVVLQGNDFSCGRAALQAVLDYHGQPVDNLALGQALGTDPDDGTQPDALVDLVRSLGLPCEVRDHASLDDLAHALDAGAPCICCVQRSGGGHWLVIQGVTDAGVVVMDPLEGTRTIPRAEFEKNWWDTAGGKRYERWALAVGAPVTVRESETGFSGIDAHGHKWVNGHQVKIGDEGADEGGNEEDAPRTEADHRWAEAEEAMTDRHMAERGRLEDRQERVQSSLDRTEERLQSRWDSEDEKLERQRGREDRLTSKQQDVEEQTFAGTDEEWQQKLEDDATAVMEKRNKEDNAIEQRREKEKEAHPQIGKLEKQLAEVTDAIDEVDEKHKKESDEFEQAHNGSKENELPPKRWLRPPAAVRESAAEAYQSSRLHRLLEASGVPPLQPEAALHFFRSLVPTLGTDPHRLDDGRRVAFTLAVATDLELLDAVKEALTAFLAQGGKPATGQAGAQVVQFIPHPNASADERLVLVDPARLDAGWAKDTGYYIPAGGGGAEIKGRRAGFEKFLAKGQPIEAPRVTLDPDGTISFTDGRHRFSLLRDLGVTNVAVMVDESQAAAVASLYGATAPTPPSNLSTPKVIAKLIDDAGVSPANPDYARMTFRSNVMDAFGQGLSDEMVREKETFPTWQMSNPKDGRSRPDHAARDGRYYPAERSFASVRGTEAKDICNCRCVAVPVDKWSWEDLVAEGAAWSTD